MWACHSVNLYMAVEQQRLSYENCPSRKYNHTFLKDITDTVYLLKPHARISLFWGKVKECCNSIASTVLLAMSSRMEVARYVQVQISNYNYTFPGGSLNVSVTFMDVSI